MQLNKILAASALGLIVPVLSCDDGYQKGKICLDDCRGHGLYLPSGGDLISAINLPNFKLDFDPKTGGAAASASNVDISLSLPGILKIGDIEFIGAGGQINVGPVGGSPVAGLSLPDYLPSSGTNKKGHVITGFNTIPFLPIGDGSGLVNLFKAITLSSGPVPIGLSGYADNEAQLDNLFDAKACLRYIGFDVKSQLIGFGGLTQTTITGLPKIVGGDAATGVKLEIPLQIVNPSNVALNLHSDVTLALTFNGQQVGTVVLPNLSLAQGVNTITATSYVNPDKTNAAAVAATRLLFSQFTGGVTSNVSVGSGKAAGLRVLDAALGALNIPQALPANTQKLIIDSTANIGASVVHDNGIWDLAASINGFNPFDTPVAITHLTTTLIYEGAPCITANVDIPNFVIPPKGNNTSPNFFLEFNSTLTLGNTVDACSDLAFAATSDFQVDVQSQLTISIGGFANVIDYNQANVTVHSIF
ncbi:hypothetical protein HDU76_002740 [Blyttiomyces sp. JEL0837]|nr:hypothetical protein HDU76_002740 [Blyttiomyces sp. JEL0837]